MANKFKAMVLCGDYENLKYTVGTKATCNKCSIELWLSNSSIESVKRIFPDIKREEIQTLCLICGMKDAKSHKFQEPSPEQIKEIKALLNNNQERNREL